VAVVAVLAQLGLMALLLAVAGTAALELRHQLAEHPLLMLAAVEVDVLSEELLEQEALAVVAMEAALL
jgi:hypothetical protein